MRTSPLAVDVFMIVSGFVIFHAVAVQTIAVRNLHNYPHLPADSRNELLLLENHLPTVTDTLLHLFMLLVGAKPPQQILACVAYVLLLIVRGGGSQRLTNTPRCSCISNTFSLGA